MYKLQNGWTKEGMIEALALGNGFKQALTAEGNCRYRTEKGRKCYVGVFIPDDLYHPDIDDCHGLNALRLLKDYPGLEEFMPLHAAGMDLLQGIHDAGVKLKENTLAWINENVE